jgi:hypothetical protein
MMFSRYSGLKTWYPPQSHGEELVSFSSSHHDYHRAQNDVIDHHTLQQRRVGYSCEEGFPTSEYPTSKMETASWDSPTSSDMQSNITMSDVGFADDCSGPRGKVSVSLNFSGRTDFIPPPNNLSPRSGDALQDQNVSLNSMALPKALDNSFIMHRLHEPVSPYHIMPLVSTGFDSSNEIAMCNQGLLSLANDSSIVGHARRYHLTPHSMNAVNIIRTLDYAIR